MAGILLENVSRIFPNGATGARNLNLEVIDQEILTVVGPSGCGKTTLLRMIAGLEPVSSGAIRIAGRRVDGLAPRLRGVAYAPQEHVLYPHMSVRRNLLFGWTANERAQAGDFEEPGADNYSVANLSSSGAEMGPRTSNELEKLAHSLKIDGLLERSPAGLSGGERQRVALGRALIRRRAAHLLDEPLSDLDARSKDDLRAELKIWRRKAAATVVYVTHDQAEAMALGDRIAVMEAGELRQVGSPADVYSRPRNRFVAGFIGDIPMNLLEGKLEQSSVEAGASSVRGPRFVSGGWEMRLDQGAPRPTSQAAPGDRWVVGWRTEDSRVSRRGVETGGRTPNEDGRHWLPGRIDSIEPRADSIILRLLPEPRVHEAKSETSNHPLGLLATDTAGDWKPGEPVWIGVRRERLHWFDAVHGDRWPENNGAQG